MVEDYAELKCAIENAGFFTTFMPIKNVGDRMVCASHRYESGPKAGGLGGTSFWVAKRRDDWYFATWSPTIYRLKSPNKLVDLCLQLLRRERSRALWDSELSPEFRAAFDLAAFPDAEFDRLQSD